MTTVKVVAEEIRPIGGTSLAGVKIGFINSGAKAAQNDIQSVSNAKEVLWAAMTTDATGAVDACTISGVEITLTSAATGATSGIVIFR